MMTITIIKSYTDYRNNNHPNHSDDDHNNQ